MRNNRPAADRTLESSLPEVLVARFDAQHIQAIKAIREAVFTNEQSLDPLLDFDGRDPEAVHVLVRVGDFFVATGRLLTNGRVGRIAVLKEYRRRGIGRLVLSTLATEARRRGLEWIVTAAPSRVVGFYESLGFVACGPSLIEAGQGHVAMAMRLRAQPPA